jgi:hypothetical protein
MTTVTVEAGACGYVCMINVEREDRKTMTVEIVTGCVMIAEFAETLHCIEWMKCLRNTPSNPVFAASYSTIGHAGCPVPAALIRAIEAEAETAVKKNIAITFTG